MAETNIKALLNGIVKQESDLELIDGATGQISQISKEVEKLQSISSSALFTLDERLEAFEDIFDSEIGDTSLVRARNLERELELRQIYLKFEGGNPTGTQKDRIAFAQAMDALRRGFDVITVATCGNYGVAVSLASSLAGIHCRIYIPETYHTKRIKEMLDLGAEIIRVPGDYETAVKVSQEIAEKEVFYDANPGGSNTLLQMQTYGEIAYEIYDELGDAPYAVAAPVSNGTTLAGIYKGFVRLYRRGKTSRIPRMVAGSSYGKNPIVQAYLKNTLTCGDLKPGKIHETRVNEPLINWHSIDGDIALEAIRQTNGWAVYATDKNMISYARIIREREGLDILPASVAGLIAFMDKKNSEKLTNDRYVFLLTGRKS